MPWTFHQKIRLGFLLLAFIPIVLGFVALRNARSLSSTVTDVARTNDIVKTLEKLLSSAKDLEVAQREFILTGDGRHITTVDLLHSSFDESVKRLRGLRTDPYSMELLEQVISQKFDEIRKTFRLRNTEGVEAASRVILADRGAQAMDDLRRLVNNMIANENRLLQQRTDVQQKSFVNTFFLIGAVLLLNMILVWWIYYRLGREDRHIRAINEDLERRVALRTEALQRSNEDLQQFAYVASHDLKEPMRMISSYTGLLERRYKGRLDEDANLYINFILDGVKRMNALITDLLEYSRAGEMPEEAFVPIETEGILHNVLANLKLTVNESGAKITWGKLPSVKHDPMRLAQIFQNLIANAIKYRGSRRPVIEIEAHQEAGEIVFSVKDNGIGIDPEHKDEIFNIFKRLHGKEYEGTGIGLAMVKKIIERHGGRVWVESTPGIGSTFYFTVPHHRPNAAQATS